MRTPMQAMAWEVWRTARFELSLRLVSLLAAVFLYCQFSQTIDSRTPDGDLLNGMFINFLAFVSICSPTWVLALDRESPGFSFRLGFSRPVSTTLMVAVPMLLNTAAAVLCFLLPALLFFWLSGISLPFFGYATVVALFVICLMAVTWSPATLAGKAAYLCIAVLTIASSTMAFHHFSQNPDPILLMLSQSRFYEFGWQTYPAIGLLMALLIGTTIFAVDAQRHGDRLLRPIDLSAFRYSIVGLPLRDAAKSAAISKRQKQISADSSSPTMTRDRQFSGPWSAHFWYEIRRIGPPVLTIAIPATIVMFVLVSMVAWLKPEWQDAHFAWMGALAICPFVYQLVGSDSAIGLRVKQGAVSLSSYTATRPLANDQMVAIKLLATFICALCGCLLMGGAALLQTTIFGGWPLWSSLSQAVSARMGDVPFYWWIFGISNSVLVYVGTTAMFLAFGLWLPKNIKLFSVLAIAFYAHGLLALWDYENGWPFRALWIAYCYFFSLAVVLLSIVTMFRAFASGFLGRHLFAAAFAMWLIYIVSGVIVFMKFSAIIAVPLPLCVLGGSMMIAPLAATAFAPTALAAHRHA